LPPSPALSIVANGPKRFEGRKLGIFITDGADANLLAALENNIQAAGGMAEIIAPRIGCAILSDETLHPAHHKIDGGPSVLFDAVVLLVSEEGAALLTKDAATRDFIADAFGHLKFIGFTEAAEPLLDKAGIADALDEGCIQIGTKASIKDFVGRLGGLRLWQRELAVDVDA
jgi:catalase